MCYFIISKVMKISDFIVTCPFVFIFINNGVLVLALEETTVYFLKKNESN